MYDDDCPLYAVVHAWMDSGPHPLYHEQMKQQVHKSMPLLARALDRLVLEHTDQGVSQ